MLIDVELILKVLPFLFSLFTGGLAIWVSRNKAVDQRLGKVEGKVQQLATDQRMLASREDLHEISLGLTEMKGQLGTIHVQLESNAAISQRLDNMVNRLEEHLLKGPK